MGARRVLALWLWGLVAPVESHHSLVFPQFFSPTKLIQGPRNDVNLRGAEGDGEESHVPGAY